MLCLFLKLIFIFSYILICHVTHILVISTTWWHLRICRLVVQAFKFLFRKIGKLVILPFSLTNQILKHEYLLFFNVFHTMKDKKYSRENHARFSNFFGFHFIWLCFKYSIMIKWKISICNRFLLSLGTIFSDNALSKFQIFKLLFIQSTRYTKDWFRCISL